MADSEAHAADDTALIDAARRLNDSDFGTDPGPVADGWYPMVQNLVFTPVGQQGDSGDSDDEGQGAFAPTGESFQAVSREISTHGIMLVHDHDVDAEFLEVKIPQAEGKQDMDLVMKVERTEESDGVWQITCHFIKKVT